MSYGFPSEQPRRRKGGGMFFLMILAIGAFLIFSDRGVPPKPAGDIFAPPGSNSDRELDADGEYNRQREEILGDKNDFTKGQRMPSTGSSGAASGWSIEDVANQKTTSGGRKTQPSKTQKGDWAIEEVDSEENKNQFRFSEKKTTDSLKTEDWSIEEVDNNQKTESGDWTIEETNTSEKDK